MAELFTAAERAAMQESVGGVAATYTAPGGDPVACTVVVDDRVGPAEIDGMTVTAEMIEIAFNPDEVADPVRDALVAVTGGSTYKLDRLVSKEGTGLAVQEIVMAARQVTA